MQLLIQRGQRKTKILRFPIFNLWAKFEVTAEEGTLINQYHVYDFILSEGKPGELKRASIRAALLTIPITLILGTIISRVEGVLMPIGAVIELSIPVFAIILFFVYHQIREQIRVSDILNGRFFTCRSVVTLMVKEQELAELSNAFRYLLEAMKNWGGKEIIELKPYIAPTLQVIEKPHENT